MPSAAIRDVVKVILYVFASFLLAALITPPLFEMGKGFAHVAVSRDTADKVAWLAEKAGDADFDTYFKRSLLLSALIFIFPLVYSLSLRNDKCNRQSNAGGMKIPGRSFDRNLGQPLEKARLGPLQLLLGFAIASSFLFGMGWVLFQLGWFEWDREPTKENLLAATKRAIKPAIGVSILEELLFRGALLGIFLRAFKPRVAIISLSFLFAAVHFLTPPENVSVANPRAASAGFEQLWLIGQQFSQPFPLLYRFTTLLVIGLILGVVRYRTASLWLPIGLHAGWVFSSKIFNRMADRSADFPESQNIFIGENLTEGLFPVLTLLLTGGILLLGFKLVSSRTKSPEK